MSRIPEQLFDEANVSAAVLEWQKTRDPALLSEILAGCHGAARFFVYRYLPESENEFFTDVVHDCLLKTVRILPRFDPKRGRLFSLLGTTFRNVVFTRLHSNGLRGKYWSDFDAESFAQLPAKSNDFRARIDFELIMQRFTTRFAEPPEIEVQKWIIAEFMRTGKFPSSVIIREHFRAWQWYNNRFDFLRSYVILRMRTIFYAELPRPRSLRIPERDLKMLEILGPELYTKVRIIFYGLRKRE
jgi:hypothetical protein